MIFHSYVNVYQRVMSTLDSTLDINHGLLSHRGPPIVMSSHTQMVPFQLNSRLGLLIQG